MSTILILAVVLATSLLIKEICRRLKVPIIVGQISAGIVLGLPLVRDFLFDPKSLSLIDLLSQLGILSLLFLAGLEIDFKKILENARDAILIALSSAFFPFIFGFLFVYFFFGGYFSSQGFDPLILSLVFGIALAVTSEGTKVKVLMDLNALDTRLGAIMVGAGAFDDLIEILGLSFVTALAQTGGAGELVMLPLNLLVFAFLFFLLAKVISRLLKYVERKETDVDLFLLVLILMMGLAALSELFSLGSVIGAFVGGILMQLSMRKVKKKEEEDVLDSFKLLSLAFLAPFFFANVGLNFNLRSLFVNPSLLAGTIFIAFIGKIVGTMAIKPLSRLGWKQLYVIGWAMNSRGAVELVIALMALGNGLLPLEAFSVLVVTSLVTTLTFPFVLEKEIRKDPKLLG
ncbi:MAG: cation:proton antiporter [Nanoarchaeota archaeon]|nr:cation:proton antiporter [Nanoarchaeota archaeon]